MIHTTLGFKRAVTISQRARNTIQAARSAFPITDPRLERIEREYFQVATRADRARDNMEPGYVEFVIAQAPKGHKRAMRKILRDVLNAAR